MDFVWTSWRLKEADVVVGSLCSWFIRCFQVILGSRPDEKLWENQVKLDDNQENWMKTDGKPGKNL